MKSYRLSRSHLLLNVFITVVVSVFLILALGKVVFHDGRFDTGGFALAVFLLIGLGYGWYALVLRMVLEIAIREDGFVEFRSWSGSRNVRITDIESIHSEFYSYGDILIRHSGGTIRVLYNIDGLHEFIWKLRNMNPQLVTWDC